MTDTPDALINEHALALHEHNEAFDMRDEDALTEAHERVNKAAQALRARLTAGDAAIKRVAELNAEVNEITAQYLAVVHDLAAARGEIAEHEATLKAHLYAVEAARELWHTANPDKQDVWPDHGHLMAWLMDEIGFEKQRTKYIGETLAARNTDLAAARGEIEQLARVLAWIKEIGGRSEKDLLAQITDIADIATTALAPKETNNG